MEHSTVHVVVHLVVDLSISGVMHSSTISTISTSSLLVWVMLPSVVLYGVATLLETSMHPYDVLEAEPEVVSGYYVDYGGVVFMLIYLAEGVSISMH